jgi:exosortase E/protease (VPEID-CTERM system)
VKFVVLFKSLSARICTLVVLFGVEALIAPLFRGGDSVRIAQGAWVTEFVHASAASVARFAIAFCVLFAAFAILRYRTELKSIATATSDEPIRLRLLTLHFVGIVSFWLASPGVYGGVTAHDSNLASITWSIAAAVAIVSAALAFIPWTLWIGIGRTTGRLWIYSGVSAAMICASIEIFRLLWRPVSRLTFLLVELFLKPFASDLVIQPDALRVGTQRFTVVISNECSGLEGIGLLIVFACMWLFLFRDEARFPQALALIPLGIATLFFFNAVRLTALVLIGSAGAPDIATGGFHSQAGWILFNSVAFGSALAVRRWRWVSNRVESDDRVRVLAEAHDSTVAFLMPFMAILGMGMISRATSGSFEWLYPLRFVAALAALWFFRRAYSRLDWSCNILAPIAGGIIFLLWISAERITSHPTPMPAALANASATIRNYWIALRILGAIVAVPVAEELAFRGFLMRRLTSADFDSVPMCSVGWASLLGSSLLFGLMHGQRWIVATLAGLVFGLLAKRTGRIGDAVVAHACANALLAVFVLRFAEWQIW